jgi:hypothetical protein
VITHDSLFAFDAGCGREEERKKSGKKRGNVDILLSK